MNTHTPGPWLARTFPWLGEVYVTDSTPDDGERFVGQVIASPTTCPDWSANAHLIAAAPELLEALELAKDCMEHARQCGQLGDRWLPVIANTRAAIAKAKGETL